MFPRMKCPGCQTENENTATACGSCGRALKARRRKRDAEETAPLTPEALAYQARALTLYRTAMWSLVPGAGLALGPAALAWSLLMGGPRFTPDQPGRAMVRVAFWVGLLNATTQWAGAVLLGVWWWG